MNQQKNTELDFSVVVNEAILEERLINDLLKMKVRIKRKNDSKYKKRLRLIIN